MNIVEIAKQMLEKYPLCDNCLGRQFAQLLTNTSNKERGKALRYVCAMEIALFPFRNPTICAELSNCGSPPAEL